MRFRGVSLLALAAVLSAGVARGEAKKELEKLKGTWTVIGHEHNGRTAAPDRLRGAQFVVAGDKLQIVTPAGKTEYRVKLDLTAQPHAITLTSSDPKAAPGSHLGIYKRDKDQVVLALDMRLRGSARPAKFEAKEGSHVMLWVLKRKQP